MRAGTGQLGGAVRLTAGHSCLGPRNDHEFFRGPDSSNVIMKGCSGVKKTQIQVLTLLLKAAGPEQGVSSFVAAISLVGGNEVLVRMW